MKHFRASDLAKIALFAFAYFVVGTLGLSLASFHENVSLVWPATGLALAMVFTGGYPMLTGVFLGAFLVNVSTEAGPLTSLGIAAGNTLEAFAGVFLLRRYGVDPSFGRLRDVLVLISAGALFATTLSATIGVLSLCLGTNVPWAAFGSLWREWWVGDMLGALVFAPFLLVWSRPQPSSESLRRAKVLEALALALSLLLVGQISFGRWLGPNSAYPHLYPVFPVLVWAALRFGPRGATASGLAVSAMAVWSTISDGPAFAGRTFDEILFFLQPFMAVVVSTTLTLAAVVNERKKAVMDLKKANEELVRLSEVKSEFASMVSHELRTPLSSIKEGIQLVLDGIEGEVNRNQRQCLGIAKSNVDRLARLIDNVLDFSKIESGKLTFVFERADAKKIVRDVYDLMKFGVKNKNIAFDTVLPEEDLFAVCDADKIRQVVINLVDNAMKYTEPGGRIRLRLAKGDPSFKESSLRIVVEDTGIGIREEDQGRIFEMFRQATGPKGRVERHGFGVGLAICKLIVDHHGGSITVKSSPGKGSVFTVSLPARPPESEGRSTDVIIDHRDQ